MLEQVIDHYHVDSYPNGTRRLVAYPGKYEGEPPIVVLIDTNDYYDETSGDVEAPTGWFGRAGKWLIIHDDRGAVYSQKFGDEQEAKNVFGTLSDEYCEWADETEDYEPEPEEANPYAGPGGLLDEFKQAERQLGTE